jgi:hypothetical protein
MTFGIPKWMNVSMEDDTRYCRVATQDATCLQRAAQILP